MTSELGNLKNRVLGKTVKYPVTLTAIEVMKVVGGYEQFRKLPIVAYNQIVKGLEYSAEQEKKAADKAKRKK